MWLSENENNLLRKSIPVKGNTIAYVSMCWEYQTSAIFLGINILHLENLSRVSQKKVLKFFPEAITAADDVKWH